jgi:hypothetical protein
VHENRYRLLLVTVTAGMYASFFVKSETKIFETLNVEEHDHVYFYVQALRVVTFVDREKPSSSHRRWLHLSVCGIDWKSDERMSFEVVSAM